MGRWRGRLYTTDRARDFDHEQDRNVRVQQIYETIDRQPYQWVVVFVAGIGFFLDGYTLFASNIALPMLAYVYWQDDASHQRETWINVATLGGTLLGQVFFGVMADKNGRKKMYGLELALIIAATLGVAMCSTGEHNSMSIFAWIIWWRMVVGVGVGADYPLSATITSEFAPTRERARMMASVFFMQPLGQISGNVVSLLVVLGIRNQNQPDLIRAVDMMWRWVIGIGVVPGVVALAFRVAIPETPRYLLDIEDDPIKAEFDATHLFGENPRDIELENQAWCSSIGGSSSSQMSPGLDDVATINTITTITGGNTDSQMPQWDLSNSSPPTLNSHWRFTKADIIQYFWVEGNWRTLLGTSLSWLLLDFGFYGIGLSSPQFLAKTWGSLEITGPTPIWKTDANPNTSIYTMFTNTSVHALVILNVGSFVGGVMLIIFANRLNRVSLQKYGFLFLAALFIAIGVMFITVERSGGVAIALCVIGQLAFNFGPNGTTYMIPAEVFPTRYRASCHGISAGAGKVGSILVQIFSSYYNFGGSSPGRDQTKRYGQILIVFSAAMILGAAVTHFFIPDVQYKDKKSKSLEVLAMGRAGPRSLAATRSRPRRSVSTL